MYNFSIKDLERLTLYIIPCENQLMPDYIAMEFFLLLAVVTASSGLIIVSDGTQTPFLLDCRIPDDSSLESINVNPTQEDIERLKIEGQCFLACATLRYKIHEVIHVHSHSSEWSQGIANFCHNIIMLGKI